MLCTEAATQRCSWEKMFWKYAINLQENTHAEVLCNFIEIALRHGCSPIICCIFSEYLFLGTPLEGCFCTYQWKYDAYGFLRWIEWIWWGIQNSCLLVYKLFEFTVELIPAIKIKQKLYSVEKITDKKIHVFCYKKTIFCLSLNFLNIIPEINPRFS